MDDVPTLLPEANGCERCDGLGFKGRLPLFEGRSIGPKQRDLIAEAAEEKEIVSSYGAAPVDLWEAGVRLVLAGETTLDEVISVVEERPV